jgi:F-type H+-transporting ATPase subunit b
MSDALRRALRSALSGAVALLLAMPALAAEEASEKFLGIPTLGWKVINFVAFFGLLAYLLGKPLQSFFANRRKAIGQELEEAERQRQEAARLHLETEQKVAALSAEITALTSRLHDEGQREREALIRQGETEAARVIGQIQQEADRRVAAARGQLAHEAAEAAVTMARELLARELSSEDRDRIFSRTLERLNATPRGAQ